MGKKELSIDEKYPINKPTLRAREQFLRTEKNYESILSKSVFDVKELIKFLSADEIEALQKTGELPNEALTRLLSNEKFLAIATTSLTIDEELEYTKALIDLASVCIDWSKTNYKPENLWDEELQDIFRIISLFRSKIGRR